MKRWLITIAIFLSAGAVVNVAVAWAGAAWAPSAPSVPSVPAVPAVLLVQPTFLDGWPEESLWLVGPMPVTEPGAWTTPRGSRSSGVGVHLERVSLKYVPRDHANLQPFGTNYFRVVHRCRAGLPLLSLEGFCASGWLRARQDALPAPHWIRALPFRLLPLRPIWPGLVVNTLLYSLVLWLLSGGPFVLRSFIRLRRGLCTACAYPVGESATCTECGRLVSHRAVV